MIGAVQNLIDVAQEQLEEIQRICSGSLSKRQPIISTLADAFTDLTESAKGIKTSSFKAYEDIIAFRDSLKAVAVTCQTLSVLVEEKQLKPRALIDRLAPVCSQLETDLKLGAGIMSYMVDAGQGEGQDDSKIRREQAAASRSDRILRSLRAKYEHKIPKTMEGSLHFVTLPVMATFQNMAMNNKSLSAMGFHVLAAGLHSTPSSDLGIIFENQMLMLFRMSDAYNTVTQEAETAQKNDNIVIERGTLLKERQFATREIRRLTKKMATVKDALKQSIAQTIDEYEDDIEDVNKKLDDLEPKIRLSKQRLKARSNLSATEDHRVLNFADPIVQAVNKKNDTNLTLFTAKALKGICKDADIVAVWLMDKAAVQLIQTHTRQDPKLTDWFLPWNSANV